MVPWAHMSQPPNGITIGSAVFAGNISVTHTQTDRPRYVAIGRIYAMRAMRPKNGRIAVMSVVQSKPLKTPTAVNTFASQL